jgi:hypothetical protein
MSELTRPFLGRWAILQMAPLFDRILTPLFKTIDRRIEEDARLQALAVEKGEEISGQRIRQEARVSLRGQAKPG